MSSKEADWARWMLAAAAGDSTAYRHFLTSIAPHVRTLARARCRSFGASEGEAEDIVQEVLLAIHLKRGTWDQSRPIGPWIAAITRNKLIDTVRKRKHFRTVPIDDVMDNLKEEEQSSELSTHEIDKLLGRLKERQRDIVLSISVNGDSIRETATRLKMSEVGVRVTLHRALRALAALYRNSGRGH